MAHSKLLRAVVVVGLVCSSLAVASAVGARPADPGVDEPQVLPEEPGEPGDPPPPPPPPPPPTTPPGFPITLLPSPEGLEPGLPAPHGVFPPQCANDFCMPDLPIPEPFCQNQETGDNMIDGGRNYGNIRDACYQLVLALAFQPAPLYFVLQQFERNIHKGCNRQFGYLSLSKLLCYAAAPRAAERAAPLATEVYGRIPIPGFNLPSVGNLSFPHPLTVPWTSADQPSHPNLSLCGPQGRSPCYGVTPTVTQGRVLYLAGVVHPVSKMLWRFRDPTTNAVIGWFITDESQKNGVMHHERQAFSTGALPLGPVTVEASYLRWEDNQTVTQVVAQITIVAPNGGGGGGGSGGDPCGDGGEVPVEEPVQLRPECPLLSA